MHAISANKNNHNQFKSKKNNGAFSLYGLKHTFQIKLSANLLKSFLKNKSISILRKRNVFLCETIIINMDERKCAKMHVCEYATYSYNELIYYLCICKV